MANYNLGEARGKIVLETDFKSLEEGQKALGDIKRAAGDSAQSQQEAWRKTGTAATVAGATIVAGFGVALAAASNFEFQMSAIQAVSGATADEMDLISEAALRIGKDTSFSASEAAQAMEELVKAGISVDDVLNGAADATVALAAAGGVDLPTAATIAANAMNQFNLQAEDLVRVTDRIAGAANASAIDMNEFQMAMSQVGAVANLAGLSFDDTALAIAAMGNAGIKGSDAGTSLKTMLMNLQPSTEKQADAMKELGLITEDGANQFYTAEGSLKSLAEISDVLQNALVGMTDAQKQATLTTLFGTDAVRGAAIVANEGAAGFNELSAAMDKTSAADVAATRMDNVKGSTEALLGSLETLWIGIGTQLIPAARQIVESINSAVAWFSNLDAGMRNAITSTVGIAGALALAGGAVIKITSAMQTARATILAITGATGLLTAATTAQGAAQGASLVSMVATNAAMIATKVATAAMAVAQGVATAAQWAFNAALTANPIGVVVMAIAALVAGLVWFFTQTELGQQIVTNVWNGIQAAVGAVVTWFQTYVMPVIQFVIDAIVAYFTMYYNVVMAVWNGIMAVVGAVVDWFMAHVYPTIEAVVNFLVALFTFLGQLVAAVWQGIVNAVSPIVNGFVTWLTDLWTKFQLGWAILWAAVKQTIDAVWKAIKGVVEPVVRGIVDFISNTWGTITGTVSGIFNNVKNAIMNPIRDALNFIGTIKDQIMGFFKGAGDWLFNAGKSIIEGFLRGLENMLGGIKSFFNGLTNMIPEIKGPPAKDRVLLTENGKLIMQSLYNGLASEMGDVHKLLNGMNATIPADIRQQIDVAGGYGSQVPQVNLTLNYTATGSVVDSREDLMGLLGHATELVRRELT